MEPKFDAETLARLAEVASAISIWRPQSVLDEPESYMVNWRVYKVKGVEIDDVDTVHFVGDCGGEGRVCSPVRTYDPSTKRGITRSGRIYELTGKSGHDSDASYVWRHWLKMNNNPTVVDVTKEYDND